jgi:uridine kinase
VIGDGRGDLVEAIAAARPRCGQVTVVAIDGGAASGKSSLAAELAAMLADVAVVHTDDLLDGWSGQFTFSSRLRSEVLAPLALGQPGYYRRYDWVADRFAELVSVPVVKTLIVEGVSSIAAVGEQLALGVFIELGRAERERRWAARDGALQPEWLTWLDNEDCYFAANPPPAGTVVIRSDPWHS